MGCHDRTWTDIDNPVFKESVAITDFQLSYFWPANYYTHTQKKGDHFNVNPIQLSYSHLYFYTFIHFLTHVFYSSNEFYLYIKNTDTKTYIFLKC